MKTLSLAATAAVLMTSTALADIETCTITFENEGATLSGTLYLPEGKTYHPADNANGFDKPLTVVHSEAAAIPQGVLTFVSNFHGDVTLNWLEDVTQFDFYDNPKDVNRAADTVAAHFKAQSRNTR